MKELSKKDLLLRIADLETRLEESEQLINAIKAGEVDAFAINKDDNQQIYTLQSSDYIYRMLIEEFNEGALNITDEGLIVYTNKCFLQITAQQYEEVIGNYIFKFIHEESREAFDKLFQKALKGSSRGEVHLNAGDKTIPVYLSLTYLPEFATIGMIITDFTEKKQHENTILQYQADLEAKNQDLQHINTELDSFTYVASHDLQEPLRKIQTFTTQILEKDHAKLSKSAKEYFNRIITSSNRMQELIRALLDYSRVTNSNEKMMRTDLNDLIQEVKANLAETIAENDARLTTDKLPVLNVIPHQFVQLFSNIIGNSLKYRSTERKPIITITCKKVDDKNVTERKEPDIAQWWQIDISDNGIGFEQEYATKIFELFQRLHGRHEYAGTGIGLFLCKRIVQNHHGIIKATGIPDEGTTVTIYLPAL